MSQLYKITLSILSVVLWMNFTVFAQAYQCKKSHILSEKTICKTSRLKSLDRRMSRSYYQVLRKMKGRNRRNFKKNQRKWVVMRNRCGSDVVCLKDFYDGWMSEYKLFEKRLARKNGKKLKRIKHAKRSKKVRIAKKVKKARVTKRSKKARIVKKVKKARVPKRNKNVRIAKKAKKTRVPKRNKKVRIAKQVKKAKLRKRSQKIKIQRSRKNKTNPVVRKAGRKTAKAKLEKKRRKIKQL